LITDFQPQQRLKSFPNASPGQGGCGFMAIDFIPCE
jgi:hypothetical protein